MTTISRLFAATALTLLLALTAACGIGSGDGDADDSALPDAAGAASEAPAGDDEEADLDPEDAMLKYAQCMREHGIDMPDPEPGGGIHLNGDGVSPDQMDAAQEACQTWMDMAEPEDGGRELTEEEKQSFLAMAACMRERGYNYPDPTFDGGRVTQKLESGDGEGKLPGPDDPAFEQDMEECSTEAGLDPPRKVGGGSTDEQSS